MFAVIKAFACCDLNFLCDNLNFIVQTLRDFSLHVLGNSISRMAFYKEPVLYFVPNSSEME